MEEREYGPTHDRVRMDLNQLAKIYQRMGDQPESKKIETRINAIPTARRHSMDDLDNFYTPDPDQPKVATLKIDQDTILHPVLKTWAGHGLEGKIPAKSVYKKLNEYRCHGMMLCDWGSYFDPAEKDATRQFCKEIIGRSKYEVEQLGGAPSYKGGPGPSRAFCAFEDDFWIYRFGGHSEMARVIFRYGRCHDAALCSWKENNQFNEWRSEDIATYSPGKSKTAILEHAGPPDGEQAGSNSLLMNLVTKPPSQETLHYSIGLREAINLEMRDGICVKAERWLVAH